MRSELAPLTVLSATCGHFDKTHGPPAINPAFLHQFASRDWVRNGRPLCLIGDSGTGNPNPLCRSSGYADLLLKFLSG